MAQAIEERESRAEALAVVASVLTDAVRKRDVLAQALEAAKAIAFE